MSEEEYRKLEKELQDKYMSEYAKDIEEGYDAYVRNPYSYDKNSDKFTYNTGGALKAKILDTIGGAVRVQTEDGSEYIEDVSYVYYIPSVQNILGLLKQAECYSLGITALDLMDRNLVHTEIMYNGMRDKVLVRIVGVDKEVTRYFDISKLSGVVALRRTEIFIGEALTLLHNKIVKWRV